MTEFSYKPDIVRTVERHRSFWSRQMPNEILVAVMAVDELPFIDPSQQCPDLNDMYHAWETNYNARRDIPDDHIPVGRVSFGSAAFGAFLGADISFDYGIGWSHPFLENYEQVSQLHFDPETEWIQNQKEACAYFVKRAAGKFPLCETEVLDGLNLVEALRGSRTYLDVYDYPEDVHRLLAFSTRFNIQMLDMQREILAPNLYYEDGIFSMFRIWLPGKAPWMSVDAYGNCSPAIFREFGAPYLQDFIDAYGGGWIHMHAHALHLLPEVTRLNKLVGIGICDDPNVPRGFEKIHEIRELTGDIPIQIDCLAEELEKAASNAALPGNVMYMVTGGVKTIEQANRLVDRVKCYQSPGW